LDSEEAALELLRTKQALLMLFAQADMCQKLVQILPPNRTSQNGLYPKLADPIMTQKNLIEIKHMILGHQLVNSATLRIHLLVRLILDRLAEMEQTGWGPSRTRCRAAKVSSSIILNGDSNYSYY
jgi:hypothetical protein